MKAPLQLCRHFYREHIREQKLQLRVQKLYASQLFEDMIPMLQFARRHAVEQLVVDKTGVVLRYLHSEGAETAFLMRPNGYACCSVGTCLSGILGIIFNILSAIL